MHRYTPNGYNQDDDNHDYPEDIGYHSYNTAEALYISHFSNDSDIIPLNVSVVVAWSLIF